MKFPKIPKTLEQLMLGLAVVAVLMKPSTLSNVGSTEWLLKKVAFVTIILGTYYVVGPKYGLYAAGAVAVFLWLQTKEGLEVEGKAIEGTQCPPKFEFDVAAQMCKNKDTGAMVNPTQVVCASGFKPNETNDKCIQEPPPDSPPPAQGPPPKVEEPSATATGSATADKAAPAKTTEKFEEGKGTIATTPGEAQEKAKNTVVLQQQTNEPETFVDWNGTGYPLQ
jgi:hypothetical protein